MVTMAHLEGQLEIAEKYHEIVIITCISWPDLAARYLKDRYGRWIGDSTGYRFNAAIIAAIVSRESQWGIALHPPGPGGTGDFAERKNRKPWRPGSKPPDGKGFGRGLMQIDYDMHEFARMGKWWDPRENISYGCGVLAGYMDYLAKRCCVSGELLLRATIAAYNTGPGDVRKAIRSGKDVDFYTADDAGFNGRTGGDYSKDILQRAQFFKSKGWT